MSEIAVFDSNFRFARHSARMLEAVHPIRCTALPTTQATFIQFTRVSKSVQWFSLEGQFRTTDIGLMADFNWVLIRNFCPSWLTS